MKMIDSKKQITETLKEIPDNKSIDEILEILYFKACIMISEDDIKNGICMTLEESEKEVKALNESYNITNSPQKRA